VADRYKSPAKFYTDDSWNAGEMLTDILGNTRMGDSDAPTYFTGGAGGATDACLESTANFDWRTGYYCGAPLDHYTFCDRVLFPRGGDRPPIWDFGHLPMPSWVRELVARVHAPECNTSVGGFPALTPGPDY
jgi:hypothetical protein